MFKNHFGHYIYKKKQVTNGGTTGNSKQGKINFLRKPTCDFLRNKLNFICL